MIDVDPPGSAINNYQSTPNSYFVDPGAGWIDN